MSESEFGKFEKPPDEGKEKRELSPEEIREEKKIMDEQFQGLLERAKEIKEELEVRVDDEHADELREELKHIEELLDEEWEEFIDEIKDGEVEYFRVWPYKKDKE